MKLLDIMTSPWMILPEKLIEIGAIYQAHIRGDKINIRAIEEKLVAAIGEKREWGEYDIRNSVAIIPIKGIISKNPSLFGFFFSRAVSTEIAEMFKDALGNPSVESILLDIDSPGGTVDGTQELAELIYLSRGIKPIIAYTDGMMTSAAYYIGAAADQIYISGDMPDIGAIGVTVLHIDYSKFNEQQGIKGTDIYAGKYKTIVSGNKPLSDEGKSYLQDRVDYVYSIFVNDVAKYRGTSVENVLANMADGKIFIGRQAVAVGLADEVIVLDDILTTKIPEIVAENKETKALIRLNNECKIKQRV